MGNKGKKALLATISSQLTDSCSLMRRSKENRRCKIKQEGEETFTREGDRMVHCSRRRTLLADALVQSFS